MSRNIRSLFSHGAPCLLVASLAACTGNTDAEGPTRATDAGGPTRAKDDGFNEACALPDHIEIGPSPGHAVVADFDEDGCPDIAAMAPQGSEGGLVAVVSWGGEDNDDAFSSTTRIELPGLAGITPSGLATTRETTNTLAIADWDGDGRLDLMSAGAALLARDDRNFEVQLLPDGPAQINMTIAILPAPLRLLRGTRDGLVEECLPGAASCEALDGQPSPCNADEINCAIEDLATGDFDGDGAPDIIAGGPPTEAPFVETSLVWLSGKEYLDPDRVPIHPVDYEIGDINKDGLDDVVAQTREFISDFPSTSSVFLRVPSEPSGFGLAQEFGNSDNHTDAALLADSNGDGCLDFHMIGVDRGQIGIRAGHPLDGGCDTILGTESTADPPSVEAPNAIGIQALDVDGDCQAEWVLRASEEPILRIMAPHHP